MGRGEEIFEGIYPDFPKQDSKLSKTELSRLGIYHHRDSWA